MWLYHCSSLGRSRSLGEEVWGRSRGYGSGPVPRQMVFPCMASLCPSVSQHLHTYLLEPTQHRPQLPSQTQGQTLPVAVSVLWGIMFYKSWCFLVLVSVQTCQESTWGSQREIKLDPNQVSTWLHFHNNKGPLVVNHQPDALPPWSVQSRRNDRHLFPELSPRQ